MPTAVRRAAWAEWAEWTCKEPRGFASPDVQRLVDRLFERMAPAGKPAGVFLCGRVHPPLATHTSKEVEHLTLMRHIFPRVCVVPCIPVATRRFTSTKGIFKCLRRILLCAWSTRQRTCFPIRRAQAMGGRCRGSGPVSPSRTGSSSYAIRVCGISACAESSTQRLRHRSQQRRCAASSRARTQDCFVGPILRPGAITFSIAPDNDLAAR